MAVRGLGDINDEHCLDRQRLTDPRGVGVDEPGPEVVGAAVQGDARGRDDDDEAPAADWASLRAGDRSAGPGDARPRPRLTGRRGVAPRGRRVSRPGRRDGASLRAGDGSAGPGDARPRPRLTGRRGVSARATGQPARARRVRGRACSGLAGCCTGRRRCCSARGLLLQASGVSGRRRCCLARGLLLRASGASGVAASRRRAARATIRARAARQAKASA